MTIQSNPICTQAKCGMSFFFIKIFVYNATVFTEDFKIE